MIKTVDEYIFQINKGVHLEEKELLHICESVCFNFIINSQTKELFLEEPNVISVYAPVVLCGDIHGQFSDLISLFKRGGELANINYVFMVRTRFN